MGFRPFILLVVGDTCYAKIKKNIGVLLAATTRPCHLRNYAVLIGINIGTSIIHPLFLKLQTGTYF